MSDIKDKRKRNFATLVYPESAPSNWKETLRSFHIPTLISPLHNMDVWSSDDERENPSHIAGTPKKPHYHIQFLFEGKQSDDQVLDIIDAIGGVGLLRLNSRGGYAAYLTHMNEPDKFHYDPSDVECLCGASYMAAIASDAELKNTVIAEMLDWCDANQVYSYAALLRYARYEQPLWFHVLNHSSTNQMLSFLRSKSWEDKLSNNQ